MQLVQQQSSFAATSALLYYLHFTALECLALLCAFIALVRLLCCMHSPPNVSKLMAFFLARIPRPDASHLSLAWLCCQRSRRGMSMEKIGMSAKEGQQQAHVATGYTGMYAPSCSCLCSSVQRVHPARPLAQSYCVRHPRTHAAIASWRWLPQI